ncbi:MAG: 4Fe-4S dicluster domain-containing protein [Dehalococcoidales bacterium]|nr:4Fe-4S dicluster domain-containing protein [Dehalococcoidales bacterium]
MADKHIVCDPELCVGCQTCEFACSGAKEGYYDPLHSRIRHVRIEPTLMLAVACRTCEDAPCVACCPRRALSQDEATGVIRVDNDRCDGCAWCIEACEFGAIALDPARKRVAICDLCSDRETPACVELCPKEALTLSTPELVAQRTRKGVVAKLLAELSER